MKIQTFLFEMTVRFYRFTASKMGKSRRDSKFYPKKVIQKKLSTNMSCEKFYQEAVSKIFFIQNVLDLFYVTLK